MLELLPANILGERQFACGKGAEARSRHQAQGLDKHSCFIERNRWKEFEYMERQSRWDSGLSSKIQRKRFRSLHEGAGRLCERTCDFIVSSTREARIES